VNQVGTKLTCVTCQAQVIVIKGGTGSVTCHDRRMEPATRRPDARP
jgi:hypothetical protein